MAKTKPTQNATFEVSLKVILKNKKGEILLLKNPEYSSMPGYCDLIGGRIQNKEILSPFKKILTREIKEELGGKVKYKLSEIPVSIGRHYYFSKSEQKTVYIFWVFFEAIYKEGEIKISKEHVGYDWVKLNKRNLKKYFIKRPLEGMRNYLFQKFTSALWELNIL